MEIVLIAAVAENGVIGAGGTIPWRLKSDLARFKALTTGKPVVMGRKTFVSIGRPLPGRTNIVVTRDPVWSAEGVETIHSPEELSALDLDGDVFIIGGSGIYAAFLPQLDELLVSHVRHPYPGDTRFPEFAHLFQTPELVESHEAFDVFRYRRL